MSAWLLRQRFDTHDKTSLGAPNRRFAIPQAGWHLSLGAGHTMNIFYIIGVVVVIIVVAGFLGLR
jgi:hypothetical protein